MTASAAARRARSAGVRSAVFVTLVAAGVAACVSTSGVPEQKAPGGRVPATVGEGQGGPHGPGRSGVVRPAAGRDGLSPSPTVSGTAASPTASALAGPGAADRPGTRTPQHPGGRSTAPRPTAQASPTAQPPASPTASPAPSSASPSAPSSPTGSPDPSGSGGPGA